MLGRMLAILLMVFLLFPGAISFTPIAFAEEANVSVQSGLQPYTRPGLVVQPGGNVEISNFEIDDSQLMAGNLTLQFNLEKDEWQSVYDSLKSVNNFPYVEIHFVPPENAKSYYAVRSGTNPDDSAVAGMDDIPEEMWCPIEVLADASAIEFAGVRQNDGKVYMQPIDEGHSILLAWKDAEGNLIDLAPEEDAVCYVEYMNVFVHHQSTVMVEVQDKTLIQRENIVLNATNLSDKYFVSEAVFEKKAVRYCMDADEIRKQADNGQILPNLVTHVQLPKGAKITSKSGEIPPKELHDGKVRFELKLDALAEARGFARSGIEFEFINAAGDTEKSAFFVEAESFSNAQTWMDIYWEPADAVRVDIGEDFGGQYGVKVEELEDGHAHCSFTKNKSKNFDKVLIDEEGEAPLTLRPPEIPGEKIVGYRMNQSAGAQIFYDPVLAKEQDGFVRDDPITYFADTGENGVPMTNAVTLVCTPILQGNKIRYNVYYPATYGDGPNCAAYLLVDWVNAEGETVSREYVYYTIEERTKPLGNMGVGKDKIGKKQVEEPTILVEDAQILYEVPMQEKTSGQANVGAQYILLDMADAQGNIVEPEEVVEVLLPYPEGMDYTDSANYTFTLQHYENEQDETGESVRVTPTENGLLFATKSFSPFLLIWGPEDEEIEPEAPQGDTDSAFVEPPYYPDYEDETQEPSSAEEATPELRYVMCNRLNLRAGPGTDHASMGLLPRGTSMTVLSEENGWASVVLADGRQGFVSTAYLFGGTWPQEAVTIARNLNVRSGPGTEFDRIDLLPRGSAVTITGIESDFCEIAWENGKAYVSVHYLAFDNAL